jgi:hypothetical protein
MRTREDKDKEQAHVFVLFLYGEKEKCYISMVDI